MLIVTHNLLFAKNAADFIARMDGGRIAAYGTPQEMLGATELRPPQPRLWFQSPPHSPNLAQQLL
jgi:ABC-type polar amino acid transport system ATPase subunit